MGRTAIETLTWMLETAYRADPFSSLQRNLKSVSPQEWDIRPATWSEQEFGRQPELAICDLALHLGAKYMYADRAFGDASLEWHTIQGPSSRSMDDVMAWLDAAHQQFIDGMNALTDDAQLDEMRQAPWRTPMPRKNLITIMISHDLYHSGEINRQRSLIRGAKGWDRGNGP